MSPLGRLGRSGRARAFVLSWSGPLRIRARGETAGPVETPLPRLPFVDRAGVAGSGRPGHENVELVPCGPGLGNRGPLPGEGAVRRVRIDGMRGMEAFGTSAGPRRGQGRFTGPGGDGVRGASSSGTDPAPGRSPATPRAGARGQENVSRRKGHEVGETPRRARLRATGLVRDRHRRSTAQGQDPLRARWRPRTKACPGGQLSLLSPVPKARYRPIVASIRGIEAMGRPPGRRRVSHRRATCSGNRPAPERSMPGRRLGSPGPRPGDPGSKLLAKAR